jgi:hypothetical protein
MAKIDFHQRTHQEEKDGKPTSLFFPQVGFS